MSTTQKKVEVHGRWYYEEGISGPICSKCGCVADKETDRCGECGALMNEAHWINYGARDITLKGVPVRCSSCGRDSLRFKHCPNCGKHMVRVEVKR